MPIYAYACASCGHRQDHLQKMADAPIAVCPECGAASYSKQLSAPQFQLKGGGWYVTDFRDSGKKDAKPSDKSADGKSDGGSGAKADAKTETGTEAKPAADTGTQAKTETGPATPAPSPGSDAKAA
jgi:putative FmdB family regulatory protein